MQRFLVGSVEPLGDREVGVIAATSQLARDGHILEVSGINLSNYRKNPIVLANHDARSPIGVTNAVGVVNNQLAARIQFAPVGVSDVADQTCRLVKAGVLKGVSIGFDPDFETAKPLDPKRPYSGQRFVKSELLEISFVSLPADTGAGVVARSAAHKSGFAFASLKAIPEATFQRAFARLLPRSGRRGLSAENASSIKLALQHHRVAMKSQRDGANVLSQMLRDDMSDGGDEERDRALLRLQILRRRQPQLEQIRHLRQLGTAGERAKLRRAIARREL